MIRLEIQNLRYHNIGPINLAIDTSECVMLSGPSGAGKTLMLRAIADLEPHEGHVYLGSAKATEIKPHHWRKRVGMLPSESQWWHDTVGEHFRKPNSSWFEILGFDGDVMGWRVSRLSSGERQRLALLRLLCNQPKVLLLDEPTANLDPENTLKVERLLESYRQQQKSSFLWISHDPEQIHRMGTRHYILDKGRIVKQNKT